MDPAPDPACLHDSIEVEDDQEAACHVLAEERLSGPPDDQYGALRLVLLHVDPATVADVSTDKDLAASHAVRHRIAGAPVDHHLPGVHRVSGRVFSVAVNDDRRPAHEHSKVATRNTVDVEGRIPPETAPDEPLPEDTVDDDLAGTVPHGFPDLPVQGGIVHPLRIDCDHLRHINHAPTDLTSRTLSRFSSSI